MPKKAQTISRHSSFKHVKRVKAKGITRSFSGGALCLSTLLMDGMNGIYLELVFLGQSQPVEIILPCLSIN